MSTTLQHSHSSGRDHAAANAAKRHHLSINTLGMALGTLLAVTFALCVAFDLMFPSYAMYPAYIKLLPGVIWISVPSFLLGLVEAFAYGWFASVIFVPVYNFFAGKIS